MKRNIIIIIQWNKRFCSFYCVLTMISASAMSFENYALNFLNIILFLLCVWFHYFYIHLLPLCFQFPFSNIIFWHFDFLSLFFLPVLCKCFDVRIFTSFVRIYDSIKTFAIEAILWFTYVGNGIQWIFLSNKWLMAYDPFA